MTMAVQMLLALLLFMQLSVYASQQRTDLFAAANRHYASGRLELASNLYRQILKEDVNDVDCMANLASVLIDMGNEKEGEEMLRDVLARTHNTSESHCGALFNLAMLLQDHPQGWPEAKALYQRLIANEPENKEAWANLGSVCQQLGEYKAATRAYRKALELYHPAPLTATASASVGVVGDARTTVDVTGSGGGSDDSATAAVVSTLYENLGRAWLSLGERDNATHCLQQAVAFNPQNAVASHLLKAQQHSTDIGTADPAYVRSLFDSYAADFETSLSALGYSTPALVVQHAVGATSMAATATSTGTGAAGPKTATGPVSESDTGTDTDTGTGTDTDTDTDTGTDTDTDTDRPFFLCIDLGCGTGLVGSLLRNARATQYLVGVDLSPNMLAAVEQTKPGVYNHLFAGELTRFLAALNTYKRRAHGSSSGSVRRKLSGGIIRDVDEVADEADFGGGFCEGRFGVEATAAGEVEVGAAWHNRLLVTSADVFVYIGDLSAVCGAVHDLVDAGDVFIFSVEELRQDQPENTQECDNDNSDSCNDNSTSGRGRGSDSGSGSNSWLLQPSGRFAHSQHYLATLLATFPRFRVREMVRFVPRKDGGKDIPGLLVVVDVVGGGA